MTKRPTSKECVQKAKRSIKASKPHKRTVEIGYIWGIEKFEIIR